LERNEVKFCEIEKGKKEKRKSSSNSRPAYLEKCKRGEPRKKEEVNRERWIKRYGITKRLAAEHVQK